MNDYIFVKILKHSTVTALARQGLAKVEFQTCPV